jgi:cytoplasmic tRNA 2-thiolation protein 2
MQTPDLLPRIQAAVSPYPEFEFMSLRLEDAFDPAWWASIHKSVPNIDFGLDIMDEGEFLTHTTADPCADRSLLIELSLFPLTSSTTSPKDCLRNFLQSMPTSTTQTAMIAILIRMLLLYAARSRRSSHLLLGNSSTSISVGLISGIAQGGGFTISSELFEEWEAAGVVSDPSIHVKTNVAPDVAVDEGTAAKTQGRRRHVPDWTGSVRIVRPLSDISMKECGLYCWWRGLHRVYSYDSFVGRDHVGSSSVNKDIRGLTRGADHHGHTRHP